MTTDYTPLYSTVAVATPVFMLALFVGRDRMVNPLAVWTDLKTRKQHYPEIPRPAFVFAAVYVGLVVVYAVAGLVAEWAALLALASPQDQRPHWLVTVCYTSFLAVVTAFFFQVITTSLGKSFFYQPNPYNPPERQSEMPTKTIRIVADDLDGKELPEETQPIRVSVGRLSWNLYLSSENEQKLQDAIAPFVKEAETAGDTDRGPAPRRTTLKAAGSAEQRKRQRAAIQEFAKAQKLKVPGDRGRIDAAVAEAYYAANPNEPSLFA